MTPDAYLSYLHSAFGVVAVRLVHLGVWGNAPCQPLMQPVPGSRCAALPAPFAYQQRYDAGHATRPALPFSRA